MAAVVPSHNLLDLLAFSAGCCGCWALTNIQRYIQTHNTTIDYSMGGPCHILYLHDNCEFDETANISV